MRLLRQPRSPPPSPPPCCSRSAARSSFSGGPDHSRSRCCHTATAPPGAGSSRYSRVAPSAPRPSRILWSRGAPRSSSGRQGRLEGAPGGPRQKTHPDLPSFERCSPAPFPPTVRPGGKRGDCGDGELGRGLRTDGCAHAGKVPVVWRSNRIGFRGRDVSALRALSLGGPATGSVAEVDLAREGRSGLTRSRRPSYGPSPRRCG